jgi:hypothetical protein
MWKKIILSIITIASMLSAAFIVSFAPTLATQQTNEVKLTGSMAVVTLQLPSNSSPPAAPGGTPEHPVTLKITAYHWDQQSTNGVADELLVAIWSPVGLVLSSGGNFQPVAFITDNAANAPTADQLYNGTYISYHVGPPLFPANTNLFPNVITVQPNDLQVWTEPSKTCDVASDTLWVNLTKSVTVSLPSFSTGRYPNGTAINTNQTFVLPPMTLMFKATSSPFDNSYKMQMVGYPGASGFTLTQSGSATFAGVLVSIPNWIGAKITDNMDATGHVSWRLTDTITPP